MSTWDPTLPEWQDKLEDARLSALTDTRATAEKWAGTVVTLIGAFAAVSVVLGPKALKDFASQNDAKLAGLAALMAGVTGVLAVGLAVYAAQGWPKVDENLDAAQYKTKSLKKVKSVTRCLAWSRLLAGVATLAVFTTGTLSAYDTLYEKDSGLFVVVTTGSGTAKCIALSELHAQTDVVRVDSIAHC